MSYEQEAVKYVIVKPASDRGAAIQHPDANLDRWRTGSESLMSADIKPSEAVALDFVAKQ